MKEISFNRGAIEASECFTSAWGLVTRRFGLYIGAGLITVLLISCIPIVNFILMGPMMGGFAYLVLRDMRDEPVDFGMIFKGFEKFLPLMVVGLIQAIPGIIFQIIQWTVDIGKMATGGRSQSASQMPDLSMYLVGPVVIVFIGYFIFSIIWHAALVFAVPLIVEHDVSVGEAIRLSFSAVFSNVGGLIVLFLLASVVGLLGVLAICLGIFVAIPVIYTANVLAYSMVFPRAGTAINYAPPSPDVYDDGSFGRGM